MGKAIVLIVVVAALAVGFFFWQKAETSSDPKQDSVESVEDYRAKLDALRTWDGDPETDPMGFNADDPKYQRLKSALNDMQAMRQVGGNYRDHVTQVREIQAARNDVFMSGEFADAVDKSVQYYVQALGHWSEAIEGGSFSHVYESSRDTSFTLADSNLTEALRVAP